ncbi:MAG TPA: signal peptidase II [Planctomycetota bacterium]|jgi:signal peptidase II|nr:signal peptidase II [Planctomycetota bacterium]
MGEEGERPGFRGKGLFFAVAAVGVLLDLVSKSLVFDFVRQHPVFGGERVPVIPGFFYLERVTNPGGVFGFGQNLSTLLAAARGLALVVILAFVRGTPRAERLQQLCLGFLFAGALGNLYDNLTNQGKVRDWLDFYLLGGDRGHFPTFNLADSMICVGAFLLLAQGLFGRRRLAPAPDRSG